MVLEMREKIVLLTVSFYAQKFPNFLFFDKKVMLLREK